VTTTERTDVYAAALVADWLSPSGATYSLERIVDGDSPVAVARSGEGSAAIAVARLWDTDAATPAEAARIAMESRLGEGSVRGPYLVWAPPRASVPQQEPAASEFVMRTQLATAAMQPGSRNEIDLPVKIQLGKSREGGGYASVIGGLSRFWTLITERVNGTFSVNSSQLRRAPQSERARNEIFDRIAEAARGLGVGDAAEIEAIEAWTVQRLSEEPLGESGFAIAQAPPEVDPSDGTLMRRLVRKRLKDASAALAGVEADAKGVAMLAIYEYAEHENVGSFVKSVDPSLYARLDFVVALVDGEVRPIIRQGAARAPS
jgi:hypothetical protein